MLAETVIAKEDVFTAHVTEHGVRPMEHGRLDKGERRLPEIEGIPRLDRYIFPILVVVAFQNFNAVRRAVDRRIRDLPHQGGQRTAVIHLVMLHDDRVDVLEIDFPLEVVDKLMIKGQPGRIDQDRFPVPDQVGVIGRPAMGGIFVTVEPFELPVDFTHPGDLFRQFSRHRALILSVPIRR